MTIQTYFIKRLSQSCGTSSLVMKLASFSIDKEMSILGRGAAKALALPPMRSP